MPSILIETGFISNKKDRDYLSSEAGVEEMAGAIANSVFEYKKSYEGATANKNN